MQIFIHQQARKHGLTDSQITAAVWSGYSTAKIRERDRNTEPQRWGIIGFDTTARSVELVIIRIPEGVLVIHANYLTKGFMQEMRKTYG